MFCINCFHENTKVINTRARSKQPQIWRRRKCPSCGKAFTTYERPSLVDNKVVFLDDGNNEKFNLGKLIISIADSFAHAPTEAKYDALWLAQSVEDILSTQHVVITPGDIGAVTHAVLKRYDELAAVQYAAKHQLISSTRQRRGRPSLHERGRPTDESPSR
jgi:transcriptional repressor NrdR